MRKELQKSILLAISVSLTNLAWADNTYTQSSGTTTLSAKTYSISTSDGSAVKVTGGTLNLSSSTISSSATSSNTDNSSFYGTNAVVLGYNASTATYINLTGNTISSTSTGGNAVFAYGKAVVTSTSDVITTSGGNSRAYMATGGGTMTITNCTATTTNGSSSVIATDRGGGTITVSGGTYTANGSNSAAIYSTGAITATNATLSSTGGESLVIEGANSITLTNCSVSSTKSKWGTLIYQSMSGDASGTVGTLTITGGTLQYTGSVGGLFYNTNDSAYIYLNGTTITNSCDTLVRCIKGSWGPSTATNGGLTRLVCTGQTLGGLIHADANSSVYLTLKSSSAFSGRINSANIAKKAGVTMDASSSWVVTGTSYINGTITNPGISGTSVSNMSGNYNVYYNSSANSSLGGLTYTFSSGSGKLIPSTSTEINENTALNTELNTFPNPFVNQLNVSVVPNENSKIICNLYTNSGQLIETKQINAAEANVNQQIQLGKECMSGEYILRVNIQNASGNKVITRTVVKRQ